jgi:hypothetical protein
MHAAAMHYEVLGALEGLAVMGELGETDAKEGVRLLVAVVEVISLKHEDGVWQVVKNLGECSLRFLRLRLRHEELCDSPSDEIGEDEHDQPFYWDSNIT